MLLAGLTGCRAHRPAASDTLDSSIVTTAPEDQRGTAFCWSYALLAHLEQRYYELTRGPGGGGFRLNLSEEYLGLLHLVDQLVQGQEVNEGLRLSDSLALVARYGVVPERLGNAEFFRAKFDEGIGDRVRAAQSRLGGQRPSAAEAARLVAAEARLGVKQTAFLIAAAKGDADGTRFAVSGGTYTPQSWLKNRLKFDAGDYVALTFPDTGIDDEGEGAYAPAYLDAQKLVKKALLYGYSVPLSFNLVTRSSFENGVLGCKKKFCIGANLAQPGASNPHANHAVLLIDYEGEASGLDAPTPESLQAGFDAPPTRWVIKNSWGFNSGTSSDPALLKRFPLPAYTWMSEDFFEASHRLAPGRYEAILPKRVCFKDDCEPLDAAHLTIDPAKILAHANQGALSRYAVEFDEDAPEATAEDAYFNLQQVTRRSPDGRVQVTLARDTKAQPDEQDAFWLCGRLLPSTDVKYVALYVKENGALRTKTPLAVVGEQSGWQYCALLKSEARRIELVLQALGPDFKAKGQLTTTVEVLPPR